MGFLRRVLKGSGPGGARRAVYGGPGYLFDTAACPYCGVEQSPLPDRTNKKCQSCGERIEIDRTLDGICSLVRQGEGRAETEWTEVQAAKSVSQAYGGDPGPLRQVYRKWLRRYEDLGLSVRVVISAEGCRDCRALTGREYRPSQAPELPNPRCSTNNRICFCEYRPVPPRG